VSHRAVIRFAPLVTATVLEKFCEGSLNLDRQYYSRGALKPLVGTEVPLVIDHDIDRKVGIVRSFMDFADVRDDWICAVCDVTDPPAWLKKNTPASFELLPAPPSPVPRLRPHRGPSVGLGASRRVRSSLRRPLRPAPTELRAIPRRSRSTRVRPSFPDTSRPAIRIGQAYCDSDLAHGRFSTSAPLGDAWSRS
jgi:hypothetical protein